MYCFCLFTLGWLLFKAIATFLKEMYFLHVQKLVPIWIKIIRRIISRRINKVSKLFEKKKFFEKYLDLSPELRMMIIDRMQTEDRCRFTKCSKLCNKEAKASNNYIHSLKLHCLSENDIGIIIEHEKEDVDNVVSLRFEMGKEKKLMKCVYLSTSQVLWLQELGNSVDLVEYATDYFIKLLKEHQSKIKHLTIHCLLEKDYDFGIENLNNLEKLHIDANIDVTRFLSKTRRKPLENVYISRRVKDSCILAENEAIYRIRNTISMPSTKFKNEQFEQLTARDAFIDIGYLTAFDIHKFIKSWQNGKKVNIYQWEGLQFSQFNVAKLFQFFGARLNPYDECQSFEIKHEKNAEITATLTYNFHQNIRFDLNHEENQEVPKGSAALSYICWFLCEWVKVLLFYGRIDY